MKPRYETRPGCIVRMTSFLNSEDGTIGESEWWRIVARTKTFPSDEIIADIDAQARELDKQAEERNELQRYGEQVLVLKRKLIGGRVILEVRDMKSEVEDNTIDNIGGYPFVSAVDLGI